MKAWCVKRKNGYILVGWCSKQKGEALEFIKEQPRPKLYEVVKVEIKEVYDD